MFCYFKKFSTVHRAINPTWYNLQFIIYALLALKLNVYPVKNV